MRLFLKTLIILTLAVALGGLFTGLSLTRPDAIFPFSITTSSIGPWHSFSLNSHEKTNPYIRAQNALNHSLPLGAGEGLAFHARKDSQNQPLTPLCQYRLSGQTPRALFWTLTAQSLNDNFDQTVKIRSQTLLSYNLVRPYKDRFSVEIGPQLAPMNWLAIEGNAPYQLVLRLYNSPLTTSEGIVSPKMPDLTKLRCAK